MSKLGTTLWKALSWQAGREQGRSVNAAKSAGEYEEWAAELSDGDIAKEAAELDVFGSTRDQQRFLALAREAADRSVRLRPYDVQLQAVLRLLAGDVIEMATGEGKTLVGAIAAAGYALAGRQVHVISVNDYLARRDAEWMGPLLSLLGVEHGWLDEDTTPERRREVYAKPVLFASVNEIGFDVLRDHLAYAADELISPAPDVAIVDEVDSVLVDEALVPLVLAGATTAERPSDEIMAAVEGLRSGFDYSVDADERNVFLTEQGAAKVEERLGGVDLYGVEHVGTTLVQVNLALHARVLLKRDVHYIVRDGKVELVNSARGRVAKLQRWPDGLQAAVEAKEGLERTDSGEVIDTITVQALIRKYSTVSGMTGTALAAGEQFRQFYDLRISQIPPNTPNIRVDEPDRVYDTAAHKIAGIVEFVREVHETGQPVLIGTHDVKESEELAARLVKVGIRPAVLNAKNDAQEASIIAEAGARGAVTVSTQMAGRGVDIRLGGSQEQGRDEVKELGGLLVIGTARHDTERLDFQLRGRAGRQGDPGRSVFFSSLEDAVVTRNANAPRNPFPPDDDGRLTQAKALELVEHAQRVAEAALLQVHASTWQYNQLVDVQRDIVGERRHELLTTERAWEELSQATPKRAKELRGKGVAEQALVAAARHIMLYHLDRCWIEHLAFLADLRESIHLRALGRLNPLDEFHRSAVDAFKRLAEDAVERAERSFATIQITEDGVDLQGAGLKRAHSTWTYMVHDNPLSGDGQLLQSLFG
ncbi:SecA DEAD domain protein [Segniliparus rotundus DSM 44985]|uniref:Protein translocase subunit SecA n=1 Tax=Segniliparus rotundus (strain ATCC BAA-972 / CDC 1076 / CIP 108378 / DSM 44985 / JCM 13578) TaxID=640132 RepID=D6ZA55_SEGRD|nr:accessory Sec system translocase SecA2 [Segniliparus rotundus]ADG98725.1 SecA DEAD domain protein [Segniliparus rotundus DSM 44985]